MVFVLSKWKNPQADPKFHSTFFAWAQIRVQKRDLGASGGLWWRHLPIKNQAKAKSGAPTYLC
jgi:hypothetical protein